MSLSATLLAAVALESAASANGRRTVSEVVMPPSAEERNIFEEWGFSEAVIDGDRVYLSGGVAG